MSIGLSERCKSYSVLTLENTSQFSSSLHFVLCLSSEIQTERTFRHYFSENTQPSIWPTVSVSFFVFTFATQVFKKTATTLQHIYILLILFFLNTEKSSSLHIMFILICSHFFNFCRMSLALFTFTVLWVSNSTLCSCYGT